ncbi:MAG: hypothetical protein P8R54_08980 [Myxococcota bacterium]|nr:hypothetical protein [Myxococcota bacterium]
MIWWLPTALAQDCSHTSLMEQRAAAWSALSPEHRALEREKRHETARFLKDILARAASTGEQKAEMLMRLSGLHLEVGIDRLLQGTDGLASLNKSRRLSAQLRQNYPTSIHADRARELEIDALIWLGRPEEALGRRPTDPHQQADLLWTLGRLDEACTIHPEDDPPLPPHPMLVELHIAHTAYRQDTVEQITWLREHPASLYARSLRDQWLAADDRDGLAVWYALFPEDDTREDLSSDQVVDMAKARPELGWDTELTRIRSEHAEALAVCSAYSVATTACLEGDPTAALAISPVLDQPSDGLLACLDAEVFWRAHVGKPSSWEQAALGDLAPCAVSVE